MKEIKSQFAHQGDVQFYILSSIPEGAKKVAKSYFARSEKSGHCHALCGDYQMFEVDGGHVINVGSDGATLNHTLETNLTTEYWDRNHLVHAADHNATVFPQGVYFVGIQRRADPFAGVFKRVID